MSFERAKSLASAWIAHGRGVAAVPEGQWEEMSAAAKAAGLSPWPAPRRVMLDEAHAAGKSLNDMVVAARYDAFVIDVLGKRLSRAERDISRYRQYMPDGGRAYDEGRRFTEGVMAKVDPKIREGGEGVTLEQVMKTLPDEIAKQSEKVTGTLSKAGFPIALALGAAAVLVFALKK